MVPEYDNMVDKIIVDLIMLAITHAISNTLVKNRIIDRF